jgi:hypothetical protein
MRVSSALRSRRAHGHFTVYTGKFGHPERLVIVGVVVLEPPHQIQ